MCTDTAQPDHQDLASEMARGKVRASRSARLATQPATVVCAAWTVCMPRFSASFGIFGFVTRGKT